MRSPCACVLGRDAGVWLGSCALPDCHRRPEGRAAAGGERHRGPGAGERLGASGGRSPVTESGGGRSGESLGTAGQRGCRGPLRADVAQGAGAEGARREVAAGSLGRGSGLRAPAGLRQPRGAGARGVSCRLCFEGLGLRPAEPAAWPCPLWFGAGAEGARLLACLRGVFLKCRAHFCWLVVADSLYEVGTVP